jgi:periplasmic protein TonB
MFEQTFLQGTADMRKPWTIAASLTGQLIGLGVLLMAPLVQTARIAWAPPLILYSPPHAAPPPARVEARTSPQVAVSILRAVFQPPRIAAPTHIPATIALIDAPSVVSAGLGTSFSDPVGGQALAFGNQLARPSPPLEVTPIKPKPTSVRRNSGVQEAMLIRQVKPPYPPLARAARISGTVRLAAIIARDGSIRNLQLISGPPLLVKAAIDAVQQWRYKPTLLSGEPVEVITEIVVNFTLSN